MYRLLPLAVLSFATPAFAAPTVVWLEQEVPEESFTRKAEKLLEVSASHVAHPELAFLPAPLDAEDDEGYERINDLMLETRTRWNEYEVEYGFAEDLAGAIRRVDVVRDAKDLRTLVDASLLMGAAIEMAMTPEEFRGASRAEAFRVVLSGVGMNRGFVQASALDYEREVARADLADGSRFGDYQDFADVYDQLPEGSIDLTTAPKGATVILDGEPVEAGANEVFARAGMHYVHFDLDGEVLGRMAVDVQPQKVAALPLAVPLVDLGQARNSLVNGDTSDFPTSVSTALQALQGEDDLYIAVVSGNGVELMPWADAKNASKRPVTVLAVAELGGTAVFSELFAGGSGREMVPGASGSLGFEIGIYNLAILLGSDVAVTPGRVVLYGNSDMTANQSTSALPMPYGGLGAYILRPRGRNATLMLGGTYGYQGPSHWGFGARLGLGIATGETSWFRMTAGGTTAPSSVWDDALGRKIPLQTAYFRIGFATRL
ncbi:MAG: hypothetical protein KC912_22055 [Proteobacteria bacterium]|nr:hypothetical protein [Pseudomonadota bacterium]